MRKSVDLPVEETVEFEIVSDQPWSGFNYYLGDYRLGSRSTPMCRSTSALLAPRGARGLSRHHTEHCRRRSSSSAVGRGADDLPGQHPAMPDGRGLADHALRAPSDRTGRSGPRRSTPTWVCASTPIAQRPSGRPLPVCWRSARTPRYSCTIGTPTLMRSRRSFRGGCSWGRTGPGRCCGSSPRRSGAPTSAPMSRAIGSSASGSMLREGVQPPSRRAPDPGALAGGVGTPNSPAWLRRMTHRR